MALQKFEDMWKADKTTVKSKQVIIKIFEENIMSLRANLDDSALATNILKERILRQQLKKEVKYPNSGASTKSRFKARS